MMRDFAQALVAIALGGCALFAHAQAYPSKPVKFVIPYPPGGLADTYARTLGQALSDRLGQPVVVENKPGGSLIIGTDAVAKSPADGYTLLLASVSSLVLNARAFKKLPYDPVRDFSPVSMTFFTPLFLMVNVDLPVKSVRDLIAYAKANPGKLNFAISGAGSGPHFGAEMFKRAAGLDIPVVFYKGSGPVLTDLLGGQVQITMDAASVTITQIKAGKLKAIAVTGKTRLASLPDVPTFEQAGLSVEAGGFQGVLAPAGTPPEAVAKLSQALNAALAQPELREKFAAAGLDTVSSTPAEFGAFIRSEIVKWGRVAKEANIKVDQ